MPMEDFYIELYANRSNIRRDYTYASYANGCLGFIEGSDYPKSDYEECYGMILDKEASDRLITLISRDDQSVEEAVREKFTGINGLHTVEQFLKENGIPYRWSADKFELGW